jgi:hypothetical protein
MKKARVNRAQYHNRQLLNRQPLTRSKFFFVLFCLLDPFSEKRCASPAELFCQMRLAPARAVAELDLTTR